MHRVLPVPGRLPRAPRAPAARPVRRPAVPSDLATLEMHPLDTEDRTAEICKEHGVGYCNITKCCTKVCPEHITITDNAIIPLKERVVDEFFDPLTRLLRLVWPKHE